MRIQFRRFKKMMRMWAGKKVFFSFCFYCSSHLISTIIKLTSCLIRFETLAFPLALICILFWNSLKTSFCILYAAIYVIINKTTLKNTIHFESYYRYWWIASYLLGLLHMRVGRNGFSFGALLPLPTMPIIQ